MRFLIGMQGSIHWRGEAGYEWARTAPNFNARVPDRLPAGVLLAETVGDVVAGVRLARARGLQVALRSGGHSWGAWGLRDGALTIDVSGLKELELCDDGETALIGPGVRGGTELTPFLAARGRTFPGGHCDTVGVSGFLLQGGQGWNSRVWGWGCQSVQAIDVVTADGELVHASEHENADLLWAARGAGPGYFAAVVRWHLRTYPAPRFPAMANYAYPLELFDEVFHWAHEMLPQCEPVCEPVIASASGPTGHYLFLHATAMVDDEADARRVFAPLETCPVLDRALLHHFAVPTTLADEFRAMTAINPVDHRYATDCMWTDAGADALIPHIRPLFAELPTPTSFSIWYGWDPPAARPDMAFSLEGNVYLATYAAWQDERDDARCRDWVTRTYRGLEPIGKGVYTGDADLTRRPDRFLSDGSFARLQELRRQHDPDGLFVSWLVAPGGAANVRSSDG
jgi:FAD/FMN-containing dehydrogenase